MADETPEPPVKYVGIPSDRTWFDPKLILAATKFQTQTFVVPGGVVRQIAKADPTRVAIGFASLPTGFGGFAVAPWGDPDRFGTSIFVTGTITWYTTRDHLMLPTLGWYAYNAAGGSIRVVTITRQ